MRIERGQRSCRCRLDVVTSRAARWSVRSHCLDPLDPRARPLGVERAPERHDWTIRGVLR